METNKNKEKPNEDKTKTLRNGILILLGILFAILVARYITEEEFRLWVDTNIFKRELEQDTLSIVELNYDTTPNIFAYDKYMIGINNLLIDTIQNVIESMGLNRYMFQHTTNIGSELFNNFKTINKTIIIGDSDFQSKYLSLATTDVLVSGYNNYDIYIESMDHKDVILEIIKNSNINVYVNSEIDYEFDDAVVVDDVDEAIARINYSGANYSSSIFTSDNKSASSFIKGVNSENVLVNASPLLVDGFNINQEQLLRKKNIIMPNIYKFNGEKKEIII